MNFYLFFILLFLIAEYVLDVIVEFLNNKTLSKELPTELIGYYDQEKYTKSQSYSKENSFFGLVDSTINLMIIIPAIIFGWFNIADNIARSFGFGEIISGLIFIGIIVFASSIISLPFELWKTFIIEEKYGFNKTTLKTFFFDKLKGLLIGSIIGIPILSLIFLLFEHTGQFGWLYVWGAIAIIQMLLMTIFPIFIMPLFNKFTPLEDGELKTTITNYAQKYNFNLKGIFTMDGSKRSNKSNAFFTGFGKFRRIVLFDTLIEKHTNAELLSILAHEMGHFKLKHIYKMMIYGILQLGFMLFILSIFLKNELLFSAFSMDNISIYASLTFFGFLYSPISKIISIAMNYLSRKHEFEADSFSVTTTDNFKDFIEALKKLSINNLSNLTPHPFNVFLNYSHPPVLERIKFIKKLEKKLAIQSK